MSELLHISEIVKDELNKLAKNSTGRAITSEASPVLLLTRGKRPRVPVGFFRPPFI